MLPRLVTSVVFALGLLALAGSASASSQFKSSYKLKLTTAKHGASAGWTVDVKLRDPGDPMKRPKILTGLRFSFPAGSRFDARGHSACRGTMQDVTDKGPEGVCKPSTGYGSGRAKVIVGASPLSFPIHSFNFVPLDFNQNKPELLLSVVLDPNNPALAFVIDGELTRRSISFALSATPDFDIHVTDIHFTVPASHRGKHRFLTTPSSCPRSKHWTAKVFTTYVDGSKQTIPIRLPCRRR